jgi:hypothetical protein
MRRTIDLQLVVYSLWIVNLCYLTQHLATTPLFPAPVAGSSGGALVLVWGLRTTAGSRGLASPIRTLISVNDVPLSWIVMGRLRGREGMGVTPVFALQCLPSARLQFSRIGRVLKPIMKKGTFYV